MDLNGFISATADGLSISLYIVVWFLSHELDRKLEDLSKEIEDLETLIKSK
ncbi:MAG: hypothetical protein KBS82_05485 [Oscillospiraceae bacterium]|nr:hypothetical protein [Candidatus Limimonas egerieequi]